MSQVIACITNNGVIEIEEELSMEIQDYFNWLKEEIEGTRIVMSSRYRDLKMFPEEVLEGQEVIYVETVEQMVEEISEHKKVTILGGEDLFEGAIRIVDSIKLAEIDVVYQGDKFFPDFDVEGYGVRYIREIEDGKYTGVIKEYYRKEKKIRNKEYRLGLKRCLNNEERR